METDTWSKDIEDGGAERRAKGKEMERRLKDRMVRREEWIISEGNEIRKVIKGWNGEAERVKGHGGEDREEDSTKLRNR